MNIREFFTKEHKPFEYASVATIAAGMYVWLGLGPALVVVGIALAGESIDIRKKVVER